MDKRIGILGAGTAGLQLGLYLRQHGVEVTLYTDRTADEIAAGRLPNSVAHYAVTLAREQALGVQHWPAEDYGYFGHHYYVNGPQPLSFYGAYRAPGRAMDYRIYHPRLLADFAARGGVIEHRSLTEADLDQLAARHDLLVVCTGRGAFGALFARNPAYSPFDRPRRRLCVGVFKGVRQLPTRAVVWQASPLQGELVEIPFLTFGGMATALVFENHVGGDLEVLAHTRYEDDPAAFRSLMLQKLRIHYPSTFERTDPVEFDVANSPLDILQGGVVPTVRDTSAILPDGTLALALGDVHATVDPLVGQGANMASYAALVLGEEIVANDVFDARFAEQVDARRTERVLSATQWTHFMLDGLDSLPPAFVACLGAIGQSRPLADEFTENFGHPERQWSLFAHPARLEAWLSGSHGDRLPHATA